MCFDNSEVLNWGQTLGANQKRYSDQIIMEHTCGYYLS